MSKQQNNRERRYKSIVDSAEILLTRNSWDSVQMQDIAGDAGIGIATLFRYFPKKHLVIVAVAVRILKRELEFFQDTYSESISGFGKLEKIFKHLNRLERPSSAIEGKFMDIFDAYIGEIEGYEASAAEYFEMRNAISGIVRDIVKEGQVDGSLPEGDAVTDEVMTMINNYGLFARKLSLMQDILALEKNPDANQQLDIIHDMYMERLRNL